MGQPDLRGKQFYEDKDRFADLFNGVFFQGRHVMKSDELDEADSELVQPWNENALGKVMCDKVRRWKGIHTALLILENQTYIDYRMVLRAMKEEAFAYEKQQEERYRELVKKEETFDNNEYLSRMKKGEKLKPVIILVLYVGIEKPWDGAVCLHDLLDLDPEIATLINNYKLNLYDFHNDKDFSRFQHDNQLLFEILSCIGDKEKLKQSMEKHPDLYENVNKDCAMAISEITKIKIDWNENTKEDFNMESTIKFKNAFEQYKDEGRDEGLKEGLKEGLSKGIQKLIELCQEFGKTYDETLAQVAEKFNLDMENAQENMSKYWIK